jgi:hypothetical protein
MAMPNTLEELLTEQDVARITGLSVASVRRWRLLRQGPKYLKGRKPVGNTMDKKRDPSKK